MHIYSSDIYLSFYRLIKINKRRLVKIHSEKDTGFFCFLEDVKRESKRIHIIGCRYNEKNKHVSTLIEVV